MVCFGPTNPILSVISTIIRLFMIVKVFKHLEHPIVLLWLVKPQVLRVAGRSDDTHSRAALRNTGIRHEGISKNNPFQSFCRSDTSGER